MTYEEEARLQEYQSAMAIRSAGVEKIRDNSEPAKTHCPGSGQPTLLVPTTLVCLTGDGESGGDAFRMSLVP